MVVILAGEEELDEEEEVDEDVKVERPGLGLGTELAGAESVAAWLDLSGNGGCGSWEGAAGVKADDSEGIEATLGAAGEEEAPLLPPPNGRAVLLYAGVA